MTEKENIQRFLHSPARAVTHALSEFEERKNALYRLTWGVKTLDEYLIPMMKGDLVSLVARPGHGKTSAMIHLAKRGSKACHELAEQGTGFNYVVVYVTWETTVEEFIGLMAAQESGQSLEDIARGIADLQKIKDVAVGNISNRIYIIGKSSDHRHRSYTPITLATVDYILRDLHEQGKVPLMVLLDYLQKIPGSAMGMDKRELVEDNVSRCKDIALNHATPVIVGVQGKRNIDDQTSEVKIPTLSDAQWSSAIEQDTDKMMGLTRPILYMEEGSLIEDPVNSRTVEVTYNLMILKVVKQRWGKVGRTFAMHFDPEKIVLGDVTGEESINAIGF